MLPLYFTTIDNKTARFAGPLRRIELPVRDPATGKPTGAVVRKVAPGVHRFGHAPYLVENGDRGGKDVLVYYDGRGCAVSPANREFDSQSYDRQRKAEAAALHARRSKKGNTWQL
jgi:hypothetical protein